MAVQLVVLERHPLRIHDEGAERFVDGLKNGSRVTFLLSLDDPFFARLGAAQVKTLMGWLGLADTEAIESSAVSKSIANAQAKIAAHVSREIPAKSAEEWYRLNGVTK